MLPKSPAWKLALVVLATTAIVSASLVAVFWRRSARGVAADVYRRLAGAGKLDLTRADSERFAFDRQLHEFSRTPPVDSAVKDPASPDHTVRRGLQVQVHSRGYTYPVNIAFAPEAAADPAADPEAPFYYVAELHGEVKYATRGGGVRSFASGLLDFPPARMQISDEFGISGLALVPGTRDLIITHPAYDEATGLHVNAVTRLRSADGRASTGRETVLILKDEPTCPSNQIQQAAFGPDGKLYISVGDAMNYSLSRDLARWGGKVLRLNLDGSPCEDNPFRAAGCPSPPASYAYARGLRNCFDFVFDPWSPRLWAGDVGETLNRIVRVERGSDHGWDGTPESFCRNPAYLFPDRFVPVGMALADPKAMGSDFADSLWVAGYSYYFGPDPGASKRIVSFRRGKDGIAAGPMGVLGYKGKGQSTMLGLKQGPDAMYFTDFFGEQATGEADGMGRVMRVAPSSRTRDLPVDLRPEKWQAWSARDRGKYLFVQVAGCGGCHRVERVSAGREGPELTGLAPRLGARLSASEYRSQAEALLGAPGADPAAIREVLAARGEERSRAWLRHHIRNPRFDNPKAKMPQFSGLGEEEIEALMAFLLSLD